MSSWTFADVWEAIASLDGIPAWQLLLRPSMAHVRVHSGEAEVLRQAAGQPISE